MMAVPCAAVAGSRLSSKTKDKVVFDKDSIAAQQPLGIVPSRGLTNVVSRAQLICHAASRSDFILHNIVLLFNKQKNM